MSRTVLVTGARTVWWIQRLLPSFLRARFWGAVLRRRLPVPAP